MPKHIGGCKKLNCDFKSCDNEAEIIRTFDAGYNASSKYALCNSHKVLEIFTKNVREEVEA